MKGVRSGKSLAVLGCIWAGVLLLHLALRLPDVLLWICFPLLFAPFLLLGGKTWFDP